MGGEGREIGRNYKRKRGCRSGFYFRNARNSEGLRRFQIYRGFFHVFRTSRNIMSPTSLPRHHQSLGAAERRRKFPRTITDHVVGGRNRNIYIIITNGREFAAMAKMRLNSQVRQYGGFTPGGKVSGRTPKLPIGAARSPFSGFHEPARCARRKPHILHPMLFKTRQAIESGLPK